MQTYFEPYKWLKHILKYFFRKWIITHHLNTFQTCLLKVFPLQTWVLPWFKTFFGAVNYGSCKIQIVEGLKWPTLEQASLGVLHVGLLTAPLSCAGKSCWKQEWEWESQNLVLSIIFKPFLLHSETERRMKIQTKWSLVSLFHSVKTHDCFVSGNISVLGVEVCTRWHKMESASVICCICLIMWELSPQPRV